jgi:hypothetical protein
MYSAGHFGPVLTKTEFSEQVLIEVSNIKFHENPSSWSWSIRIYIDMNVIGGLYDCAPISKYLTAFRTEWS